ncbi:hypothetical protein BU25DRAFT_411570 [Macroventuria anomochaeta]|uniref:Uncharacterized protein n=1 Tax=Macroventuria anomochaeta TaxID=301207 RepID=A0ACB6RXU5_9PLEO|nr:uncharacterized protein BU25DRAFT_411570 [Macroventuria anomochaeta]KAF2626598.1 hypothetical protein BU25DRAFT_411570 [Macroventuria anomochaeta]
MASDITEPPTAAPQKMSRYRSVRRAQEQQAQQSQQHSIPPMPPVPAMPELHTSGGDQCEAPNSNIGRSMSRYHRRPPTTHATSPNAPPLRSNTAPQAPPLPQTALPPSSSARHRALSTPQQPSNTANNAQPRPRTAKHRAEATPPLPRDARQQVQQQQYEDPRVVLQKERERQRLLKEKMEAEARAQKEAKLAEIERLEKLRQEEEEAARLEAERVAEAAEALRLQREEEKAEKERGKKLRKAEAQKMIEQKKEEERRAKLEKENRARLAEKSRTFLSQSSGSPPVSPPRQEGFGLFKRRKDEGLSLSSDERPTTDRPRTARQNSSNEQSDARPRTARQPSSSNQPEAILSGGGGAVLGIDAPTSAVNGGERRVTVVYNKKRIQLPVTPTTTSLDLFKSADLILTDTVPVRTAVAMEWFKKVDIKRPLRNYEYVRDVMNSWDFDDQNELIIVDSLDGGIDQDELLSYGVPDKRPEGVSCMMNYSSRPGKWAKRYFLLRPDGQLVTAKNEKARDQENVCHLTDYDIYHVTQAKIARVKPPKKICFAVKSLQKSNIFADESQYVHFFCTNDKDIANTFWKALQVWRSWHLKHEKGEGLKKSPGTKRVLDSAGPGILPGASSHSRGDSVGSHYQLGAFTSLIDMSDFNKKLDEIEVHKPGEYPDDAPLSKLGGAQAMHARRRSVRAKQPPPLSRGLAALATNNAPEDNSRQNSITQSYRSQDEETFAAGGLLGRTYTTRQKAAQDREQKQNGAFTEGPSLISNMDHMAAQGGSGLNRSSSTRSNHHRRTSSDIRRTASKRIPGMPQPLVDLTPQYRPPPQFAKQGKGYNPGAGAGPLVESATSMEEAIQVPSSTDWRARARPVYAPQPNERTKSLKGRGEPLAAHTFNNHSGAPQDDREAFTGGLLSQASYAQGNAKVGRGVMDGSKARGPMLDFGDEKQFQSGSLLANIGSTNAPVIDRSGR